MSRISANDYHTTPPMPVCERCGRDVPEYELQMSEELRQCETCRSDWP